MDIDAAEAIKRFVLEAGANTYAAGMAPITFPGLSGSKLLWYDRPPYKYNDIYFTSPIGVSFGFTLVWHCTMEKPIWRMSYDGWYDRGDPRIMKFLKAALRAGCNEFSGGRGPAVFTTPEFPSLVYYNQIADGSSFTAFSGRDKIVIDGERDAKKRERYWHEYRGGMLIGLEQKLLSPCCDAAIIASIGDGVLIGTCSHCLTTVTRKNPKTGALEWLDGKSPWTEEVLRPIET